MILEVPVIIAFLGGLVLLCIILKLLSFSFKTLLKFALNAIIGGAILFLYNMFLATLTGFVIPITWVSALIVGIFGVPGLLLLVVLTIFF